jgi:hypothetical protein
MYRIDNSTSSDVLDPPTAIGKAAGYFSGGNPGTATPATIVDAEWLNMIQEEGANLVLAAGLALDKSDRTQWTQAVAALLATGPYVLKAGDVMSGRLYVPGLSVDAPPGNWSNLSMFREAGQAAQILATTSGSLRWEVNLASAEPETGGNAGSNIHFARFDDAGVYIDIPLSINRATGIVNFARDFTINGAPFTGPWVVKTGDTMTGGLTTPLLMAFSPSSTWGTGGDIRWGAWADYCWYLTCDPNGNAFLGQVNGAGVYATAMTFLSSAGTSSTLHGNLDITSRAVAYNGVAFEQSQNFISFAVGNNKTTQYASWGWYDNCDVATGTRSWVGGNTGLMSLDAGGSLWNVGNISSNGNVGAGGIVTAAWGGMVMGAGGSGYILQFSPSYFWEFNPTNGFLSWFSWRGRAFVMDPDGTVIFGGWYIGIGDLNVGPDAMRIGILPAGSRYISFTPPNPSTGMSWELRWTVTNGALGFYRDDGFQLFQVDGSAGTLTLPGNLVSLWWYNQGAGGGVPYGLRYDGAGAYMYANGGPIQLQIASDQTFKRNIAPTTVDALAVIRAIPLYEYDMDLGPTTDPVAAHFDCGFVAQDLEPVITNSVQRIAAMPKADNPDQDADIPASMFPQWQPIVAYLMRAVQQLAETVDAMKAAAA